MSGAQAANFSRTTTCGSVLAAGSHCTISVMFGPLSAGGKSVALQISDNAAGSPHRVIVTGAEVLQGEIVNQNSGKCLDVPGGSTADQVKVQQFTCNGGGNQHWQLRTTEEIVNTNSGKCLDVPSGSTADQVALQQFACNGGSNQKWQLRTTGEIVNTNSGKCVDVPNGSTADQVVVQQFTCNGGNNQKWSVRVP